MIYTCSYENFNSFSYKSISIDIDKGQKAKKDSLYLVSTNKNLIPSKQLKETWQKNKTILTEEENTKYFIEEYYKNTLSILNPEKVYKELDYSFLLSREKSNELSARHIVAAWLELLLNIDITEVKVEALHISKLEKPKYIKNILETIIKENTNMRGFNSLRALYLYLEGEKLEEEANRLEDKTGKDCSSLRQAACYMRCEADMAEDKYNERKMKKLVK